MGVRRSDIFTGVPLYEMLCFKLSFIYVLHKSKPVDPIYVKILIFAILASILDNILNISKMLNDAEVASLGFFKGYVC